MKRFLVFMTISYYPSGGWDDFYRDADTIEEARELAKQWLEKRDGEFSQIIDLQAGKEVN